MKEAFSMIVIGIISVLSTTFIATYYFTEKDLKNNIQEHERTIDKINGANLSDYKLTLSELEKQKNDIRNILAELKRENNRKPSGLIKTDPMKTPDKRTSINQIQPEEIGIDRRNKGPEINQKTLAVEKSDEGLVSEDVKPSVRSQILTLLFSIEIYLGKKTFALNTHLELTQNVNRLYGIKGLKKGENLLLNESIFKMHHALLVEVRKLLTQQKYTEGLLILNKSNRLARLTGDQQKEREELFTLLAEHLQTNPVMEGQKLTIKKHYLVGVQSVGVLKKNLSSINIKLALSGYTLDKETFNYPPGEEKPPWFANAPTVLYYSPTSKIAAQELANLMFTYTNIKFRIQRGAGLGVAPNQKDLTLFVHYIKQ